MLILPEDSKPVQKKDPFKETKFPTVSVWDFAQECFRKMGKGVVDYGGTGTPIRYLKAEAFTYILGEPAAEIRKALNKYNPETEMIIATPQSEGSEIKDFTIVKQDHPLAHLKLAQNLKGEEFK